MVVPSQLIFGEAQWRGGVTFQRRAGEDGTPPSTRLCYSRGEVLIAFYILAALQILAGLYALWLGVVWLQFARRRAASHQGFYAPRAAVICPCKGLEAGLDQNLAALTRFDYPDYTLFFTLASSVDPALTPIRRLSSASKHPIEIVIAGPPENCGEKVNNLRAAVEKAGGQFDVFVFVDSDGRPGPQWLAKLVAPLADSRLGATTTFRWYFPTRGGFWSALASAWNAPIATLNGEKPAQFCWGGGTAIRRPIFEDAKVREHWKNAVSDDYAMTIALESAGRRIEFLPECLVPSFQDTDFDGLMEFTNRQMTLTRVCRPKIWLQAGLSHLLYCATLVLALVAIVSLEMQGITWTNVALTALLVPVLAAAKGILRLMAVSEVLPQYRSQLFQQGWIWTLLPPLVPFLYAWNVLVAATTRRIRWRGIRYELLSPLEARTLKR